MPDHVFVCYARKNQDFVLKLATTLKEYNVPVWVDQWHIPPSADWDHAIDEAIDDCAYFLIVLSPEAIKSREVRGELRAALDANKPIVPVLYQPCRIPRQLLTVQYVDYTSQGPGETAALRQLLHLLDKPELTLPQRSVTTSQKLNSTDQPVGKVPQGLFARVSEQLEPKLELIDSFPSDNEEITANDIKKIYLKFNKPIDFESTKYIANYYVRTNSFCQWNTCGWIQMEEDDTKISWHVKEEKLTNLEEYGSQQVDYHTFEIHIGREPYEWRVQSKDGDKLPLIKIKVRIK